MDISDGPVNLLSKCKSYKMFYPLKPKQSLILGAGLKTNAKRQFWGTWSLCPIQ